MRFGKPVETYFSTGFYVDISMICANNLLNKKDFYVKKVCIPSHYLLRTRLDSLEKVYRFCGLPFSN